MIEAHAAGGDGLPRLLFLVTEDWYFLSHRLPMALAAKAQGFQVHVATRVDRRGSEIQALGFTLHPLDWRRGSLRPRDVWSIIRQVRALYRELKPDLVHHVALQPAVIGSFAAFGMPIVRLNALAGLGFVFTSQGAAARMLRPGIRAMLRLLFKSERSSVLVQNPDDQTAVLALGIPEHAVHLIPGSGVDTDKMLPLPEPTGPMTMAFVGRLLDDKGVRGLVAAHELMTRAGEELRLLIAGDRDPANPASIPAAEVERWRGMPNIEVLGHLKNIEEVWRRAHIAVLPSRREGLPKSLLEAAAYGRPIVATDVPGCREIARHGLNALLVPPDDPVALADALALLARDPTLRANMGRAGRILVEQEFSSARVGRDIVALYERLLPRRDSLLRQPQRPS